MLPGLYIGVSLFTLLVCKFIHSWIFSKKKLVDIPGPKGWPLVGNSFQMDPLFLHKTLTEWSMKYGDMFKIKIFQDDAIIFNDYESIVQMLNSEACSSRPYLFRYHEIVLKNMKDIVIHPFSAEWNDRKKALTRSMNAYGSGSTKIESITLDFVDILLKDIKENTNDFRKCIDMRPFIHNCTAGIISTLTFGRKLAESELIELLKFERGIMKFESYSGLVAALDHFPWMSHLPLKSIQEPMKDVIMYRRWVMEKQMERQTKSAEDQEGILSVLRRHVNKVSKKLMTKEELAGITQNIIIAGLLTSTSSLYSLILVLINFPNIQDKMYEEIKGVTKGADPKVLDRPSMMYVKAVMEEIFRYSSVVPLGIPHFSWKDTVINGKNIPNGTTLMANLWGLHHDKRYFDEPWKFKPERFLDDNGELLPSDHPVFKHNMPFGVGRRICPGEGLARSRIFLIIASLLQKYKFFPEDENHIPSCDPSMYDSGIVILPKSYRVKIVKR